MDFKRTKEALEVFARRVVLLSQNNLKRRNISTSGELYGSIGYVLNVYKNSFNLEFSMADYGTFVDQGVKGSKSTYTQSQDSPYKYSGRFKMIPIKSLDKWLVKKGIAPRNKAGQFIDRKNLKYAMAISIYRKGIKATKFFTDPFETSFEKLPEDVTEAFGLDIDEFIELTT